MSMSRRRRLGGRHAGWTTSGNDFMTHHSSRLLPDDSNKPPSEGHEALTWTRVFKG